MKKSARIQKSWDIRKGLVLGIIGRGETFIEALKQAPEIRDSLTFERWKGLVRKELDAKTKLYGNGEPLLSEEELNALASIMNPNRGW